jgi:hypothetical protein
MADIRPERALLNAVAEDVEVDEVEEAAVRVYG